MRLHLVTWRFRPRYASKACPACGDRKGWKCPACGGWEEDWAKWFPALGAARSFAKRKKMEPRVDRVKMFEYSLQQRGAKALALDLLNKRAGADALTLEREIQVR